MEAQSRNRQPSPPQRAGEVLELDRQGGRRLTIA